MYSLCPLALPQLDEAQDHVELVGELVGVGPQGLHDVLDPGEVLGQLGDLGAVAEDGHGSFDLPSRHRGMRSERTETWVMDSRLMLYSGLPVCITRGMVEWG